MNGEPVDNLLRDLQDELAAVRPSPEFRARVLAAVERQSRPVRAWWQWLAVAAVPVAAVVIAMVALREPPRVATEAEAPAGATAASNRLAAPSTVAPSGIATPASRPDITVAQTQMRPQTQQAKGQTRTATPARGAAAIATATHPEVFPAPPEPAFEVITNQPEVIRRMLARFASARQSVLVADDQPSDAAREIVVRPIEVQPIYVRMLEDPLPDPGGVPIIRRAADAAARSEK